jgi:hypothetical protein
MRTPITALLLALVWLGLGRTTASQTGQPPPQAPQDKTLIVKIEGGDSRFPGSPSLAFLKVFTELFGVAAWPIVFITLLITQRKTLTRLLEASVVLVQSSTRIKIGDLIDLEVDRSAEEAEQRSARTKKEVPPEEIAAAERVSRLVTNSELPDVRSRMLEFAREYEATRSNMKPGAIRTREMNEIVAKMRTIALAAKPLLDEFVRDDASPGARLAAITILQLNPRLEFVSWLAERMSSEQPFVFFHASVALLATARSYGSFANDLLRSAIQEALRVVTSFKGGPPDQNTIDVLKTALSELGSTREN